MPRFRYQPAPDVAQDLSRLVEELGFSHIDPERIHCRRSWGSTSDADARIWEFPSIWQDALGVPPQYVIEVLSQHYDGLERSEQLKILIHELLHIPSTFSGALRNHSGQGETIDEQTVDRYYEKIRQSVEDPVTADPEELQFELPLF